MKTTSLPVSAPEITHDRIALRAHELWEANDRPWGRDLEFWHQAERELRVAAPVIARRRAKSLSESVDGLGAKTEELLDHTGEPGGGYSATTITPTKR